MKLALMIEGQEGGFDALMRSDHSGGLRPPTTAFRSGSPPGYTAHPWTERISGGRVDLGGQGKRRAPALAAEHADEYNLLMQSAEQVRTHRAKIRDFMGDAGDDTWLVGTPAQPIEQIKTLEEAGLDRIMLQHHLFGDDDAVRLIADEVLPAL